MNYIIEFFTNPFVITAASSWLIAQIIKGILYAILNKKFDIHRLFGDGGMPSCHSATVVSLAVITALLQGLGSFEFAISAVFAAIVCHDAMNVRLETEKQAYIIEELVDAFKSLHQSKFSEVELKRFVGHTPLQVLVGSLIGACNAVIMYFIFR